MMNTRYFLAKKPAYQTAAKRLLDDLRHHLHLETLTKVVILNGFDVFDVPEEWSEALLWQVLGDPVTDEWLQGEALEMALSDGFALSLAYLPGQFDQRADAAMQAARLLSDDLSATEITSFTTYIFEGDLNADAQKKITHYLLNPVDSQIKNLSLLEKSPVPEAAPVAVLNGFRTLNNAQLSALKHDLGLALTDADMAFIQSHFITIERDPTETEMRVLDTYWSDHCRHTTFLTQLERIEIPQGQLGARLQLCFEAYLLARTQAGIDNRPITLMDLATINARLLRQQGELADVEVSDEINACSVFINVIDDSGQTSPWLLQFKNETHNHPTEIEPFGGASTCLGGAIRDPLSGRAFVYQAMRVSGAADPRTPVEETLPGKLPQIKICREAADGYAAYGNQIGLATTQVAELYHPGYVAKRMEVGAVVAAVPYAHIKREKPVAGDVILLIGGRTGRDGCGGASGSSKAHHEDSLTQSGAEVQKGNPPVERAIQRLFRHADVAKRIKKCNDFGAGGVCVAVGELADSLEIDLDKIPVKYQGLSGTELTISESQERMAVVLAPEDVAPFMAACLAENVEATVIAKVTDSGYMTIYHKQQPIVHLSRPFLDSAGAPQHQAVVRVSGEDAAHSPFSKTPETDLIKHLQQLKNASQRGLQDQFDFNIGASTVLLPYGGRYQETPAEGSVQLVPHFNSQTASIMTYGFDPDLSSFSPFHGGAYAVVHALAKQVVLGANWRDVHFSFQEYFEKLGSDATKWGKPFAALLGAFSALLGFNRAAIGGKDSMSGSFGELHVPPTLIAFAVSALPVKQVLHNVLSAPHHYLYLLKHKPLLDKTPNFEQLKQNFDLFATLRPHIVSAITVKHSGAAVELAKSALGNGIGFEITEREDLLFGMQYGSIVIESDAPLTGEFLIPLGKTTEAAELIINNQHYALADVLAAYQSPLQSVYPLYLAKEERDAALVNAPIQPVEFKENKKTSRAGASRAHVAKPRVFLPVFPGMNSEYDMAHAFLRAGAQVHEAPFVNLSQSQLHSTLDAFCDNLKNAQIFALSGGFSAGDEPNGSGKYIAMVLKQQKVREAIAEFLARDGLILGICNGFQALVKSGLLPYGEVRDRSAADLTLEHNENHRHIARIVKTRVCQNQSPWLSSFAVGEVHDMAISHGEGRFVVPETLFKTLLDNQQIATQYCDAKGQVSMAETVNPNGSFYAIEGIVSPCGRVFGKMGHSERYRQGCYQNYGTFAGQDIFLAGVNYFKT